MAESEEAARATSIAGGITSLAGGPIGAIAGTGLSVISTLLSVKSSKEAAQAAGRAAELSSRQYERNARQELLAGERTAKEIKRQGEVIQSDTKAAMAASGGTTTDVNAVKTQAEIEQVVDYNALAAIYESEESAKDDLFAAKVVRAGGQAAQKTAKTSQIATVLGGASDVFSIYDRYKPPTKKAE